MSQEPSPAAGPDASAQRSADRLALALEDIGFDVGQDFPRLRGGLDYHGAPVVEIGRVALGVADRLSALLRQAAPEGMATSD